MIRYAMLSVLLFQMAACGGEETPAPEETPETETPETPETDTPDETAEAPEEPSGPDTEAEARVATDSYVVELRPAEGYTSGELGTLAVHVSGQGEWHLNQDFPFAVEVAHTDELTLPKERLSKEDAAEFGETEARVDVPLTPTAAGEHAVSAEVSFAVCIESSCVPHTATVGARLAVQ